MSKLAHTLDQTTTLIKRPHVTERSTVQSANVEHPVYTFVVDKTATKGAIATAIKTLYNVKPVQIRTVTVPAKRVFIRGKIGRTASFKKALVYLKKGDKIDFS